MIYPGLVMRGCSILFLYAESTHSGGFRINMNLEVSPKSHLGYIIRIN